MLSNNNAPLPSVPSKHGPSVQYYISSRLESGEKAPDVTSTNFWNKGVWQGKKKMKFSNGVLENGGMIEGYVMSVCWNELLMQHLVKLFQF